MFFEGSEKKAEILVDSTQLNLLTDIKDDFWAALVDCCHARILSSMQNEHCKAFLLSESSLLIWQDRLLILTCGVTQLTKSIEYFLQHYGSEKIKQLTYQRKNEYFAQAQPSCFGDDIKCLAKYFNGKAYRFGEMDSHHNYIFHSDNGYVADSKDKSYEFLAYQISAAASEKLTKPNLSAQEIRQFLCLDELLPGFLIDDYVFDPYGYSLNAIKDQQHLIIHVTPQADSSYISFESNINLITLADKILAVLSPKSFDLISFNESNFAGLLTTHIPPVYLSKSLVSDTLSNGALVNVANFIRPESKFSKAVMLDIDKEHHAL
ncbi:MAG: adenosylmethionine decarboxylase [Thalassotalea sp.]